jgi:TRAP-type mannitol/chloroaromatic compound transport system permease large subunit
MSAVPVVATQDFQGIIAILVVIGAILIAVITIWKGIELGSAGAYIMGLATAVISFYFGVKSQQ